MYLILIASAFLLLDSSGSLSIGYCKSASVDGPLTFPGFRRGTKIPIPVSISTFFSKASFIIVERML